jgi:hypothetical protein
MYSLGLHWAQFLREAMLHLPLEAALSTNAAHLPAELTVDKWDLDITNKKDSRRIRRHLESEKDYIAEAKST